MVGPFLDFWLFGALWTHKMTIKPAKMAILGPNLNDGVPSQGQWWSSHVTVYPSIIYIISVNSAGRRHWTYPDSVCHHQESQASRPFVSSCHSQGMTITLMIGSIRSSIFSYRGSRSRSRSDPIHDINVKGDTVGILAMRHFFVTQLPTSITREGFVRFTWKLVS